MSFPYMNTNLTRRIVFNKQVDKRNFSQGLMSFPYMKQISQRDLYQQASRQEKYFTRSYVLSLYEYKSHKETCIQQASRQEKKRQTWSEKGRTFSQGLMSFPYMNANLTRRLVFNKQADKR